MSKQKKKTGRRGSSMKNDTDEPTPAEIKKLTKQSQKLLSRWEQDFADIRKSLFQEDDDGY